MEQFEEQPEPVAEAVDNNQVENASQEVEEAVEHASNVQGSETDASHVQELAVTEQVSEQRVSEEVVEQVADLPAAAGPEPDTTLEIKRFKKVIDLPAWPLLDDKDFGGSIELIAEYRKRKHEIQGAHRDYVGDHPELKLFLADYLHLLLQRKPDNVYSFTTEYFKTN